LNEKYISDYANAKEFISHYDKLKKVEIYIPTPGMSIPSDSDYKKGYYYRYFYRLSNDKNSTIYECKESEYNKIKNDPIYRVLKIKWKLIGPSAKEINEKIINTANNIMPGIKSILIEPLQFWKNLPDVVRDFDVTDKIPRIEIKKKRYNINVISAVLFDDTGLIYLLTELNDIIYTEDGYGLLIEM